MICTAKFLSRSLVTHLKLSKSVLTRATRIPSARLGLQPCQSSLCSCGPRLNEAEWPTSYDRLRFPNWWLEKPSNMPAVLHLKVGINEHKKHFEQLRCNFTASPTHTQLEMFEQLQVMAQHGPNFRFGDSSTSVTRGRPTSALNKRELDTRRYPSGFELVEGSTTIKRKCGAYGLFGHNSRTCQSKQDKDRRTGSLLHFHLK